MEQALRFGLDGPVGITEKQKICADYEQLFRPVFSSYHEKKNQKHCSVRIKKLHKIQKKI